MFTPCGVFINRKEHATIRQGFGVCLALTSGAVAKWKRSGLQNRYTGVRFPPAPHGMRQRVGAIILQGDRVLLFYRRKNKSEYYAIPGGGVERGEGLEEAVIREVKEETNLDIVPESKVGELEIDGQKEIYFLVREFKGEAIFGGEEKERSSPENVYRLEWINASDISHINLRPEIRDIIQLAAGT